MRTNKTKVKNFTKTDWIRSFISYAHDNLTASQIPELATVNTVRYKLVCDAIEFTLKGLLLSLGYELSDLKTGFGHGIYALTATLCLEWVIAENGDLLDTGALEAIKRVSPLYEDKSLHYPNEYTKDVPGFKILLKAASSLLEKLESEFKK